MNTVPELPVPSEKTFQGAHQSLMMAFQPMRAFCAWVDAPFGRVFVASTSKGLCRVTFRKSEDEILSDLEKRSLLPEMAPERVEKERKELEEYFEGKRTSFDVPVDIRWGTPFQKKVLEAASRIPFGACECYGDVAKSVGRPQAQRAVGNALGKNPVPIVIPCHRVVATGGGLGGYTGGLDIKRSLMEIEGIEVERTS